jgi:hypothetical protein
MVLMNESLTENMFAFIDRVSDIEVALDEFVLPDHDHLSVFLVAALTYNVS